MKETVDVKALNDLIAMLDKSVLNEVRLAFLEDCQEKMPLLRQAWQDKDLHTLAQVSHSLKSASSNLALLALSQAFSELEAIGSHGQIDDLPNSLHNLDECYEHSIQQLNDFFEPTHSSP